MLGIEPLLCLCEADQLPAQGVKDRGSVALVLPEDSLQVSVVRDYRVALEWPGGSYTELPGVSLVAGGLDSGISTISS